MMVRGKLILICQSGGDFVTNDDGSLSYTEGEAHALDVTHETLFDDLKWKLAEIYNLECKTISIKYFLPGNRRTLITLSNDKDLKRMIEFHKDSVTGDVFASGTKGFDRDALNRHVTSCREIGIKLAETVNRAAESTTAATNPHGTTTQVTPVTASTPGSNGNSANKTSKRRRRLAVTGKPSATDDPGSDPPTLIHPVEVKVDMTCTPADSVKKRRRFASSKIVSDDRTIGAVVDDIREIRRMARWNKKTMKGGPPIDSIIDFSIPDGLSLDTLVGSWKDGITGVGQEFKSVHEFRAALQKYAIAQRFVYRLKKNDSNRASGRCSADGCSWRIYASWVQTSQSFTIKKMNMLHTCGGESWKSAHPTKNWLVSIIKDRLQDSPHHKPKAIANEIMNDFGVELNYSQVWRATEDARKQLQGSYESAYNQLPWFCEKVMETNPGSFAKFLTNDDKKFQCLFISFYASIHGFQTGCRPLLFLDSTSLKSKYQEILLVASAVDADDFMFPVALGVVDVENDDNWRWFLEQLKSSVSNSRALTFVSDCEKGLKKSVLEVFENAHHGYSMNHLMETFKRNWRGPFLGDGRGALPGSFTAAAQSVRLDGFRKYTEQIKRVSPATYDWVMKLDLESWTSAVFRGECYNKITIDVEDTFGKWIDEKRELPIVQKIDFLRGKIMDLMNTRRMVTSDWSMKLTPSKEEKLQEEAAKAHELKVLFSSDTLFEVHDESTNINVVNLEKFDCTCLTWRFTGIPCCHAIAVFNCTGKCAYDYCSRYFTIDSFHLIYSESIYPVLVEGKLEDKECYLADSPESRNPVPEVGNAESVVERELKEEMELGVVRVFPPCPRPKPLPGEKKRKRAPRVVIREVFCTRCKGPGHNKKTCKAIL